MKNIIFFAALLCGTFTSVNAEEIYSPEQVINAEVAEAQDTTVVVNYILNPTGPEYESDLLSSKYNYQHFVEEKGLRKWKVEATVGNDVEPAVLWSANREGAYVAAVGQYSYFDDHNCFGGGIELGYLRKNIGFSVAGTLSNGYEAKSSDRHKSFSQLDVIGRLYSPRLETHVGRSVLWASVYGEFSFKKRKDLQYDTNSSVYYQEIDEGIEIVTRETVGRLDARPHVLGWAAGLRVQYDVWGSPISVFATADYGKSQNFNYKEKQWQNQFKCQIGISVRLFNNHGYNKQSLQRLGYSEKEVKRYNW
jgi:hypothetical protein